jgi:hypothetical protein
VRGWPAVRPISGEGRKKEGISERGWTLCDVISDVKWTHWTHIANRLVCSPELSLSSPMILDPDPVTRRGILLARVVFDDDD